MPLEATNVHLIGFTQGKAVPRAENASLYGPVCTAQLASEVYNRQLGQEGEALLKFFLR